MHSFRLLFLAPFAPSLEAAHGGSRVIAQLIGQLARRHRIALCYLRSPDEPSVDRSLQAQCEVVEEVVLPRARKSGLRKLYHRLRVWSEVLSGKPLWAIYRSVAAYSACVSKLIRAWSPDVIQIEYHIRGQYLPAFAGCPIPRILVQHDPGTEAARQAWRHHHGQGLILPYLNLLAWKRFEQAVMQQVQAVVVFTERDRRTLATLERQAPIVQIPLGTEIPLKSSNPLGDWPPNLLFVGNFLHYPNVDAALRLIHTIFPTVQARFPDTTLVIVGAHPPPQLTQQAHERVVITGYVPDLAPYLDRATAVVAPLRLGGGMRVKVMEALAAGKAVVASPLAVEGLALADGEQIVLAGNDRDFSAAIIRLLSHADQRAALAVRGRQWARANLGWEKAVTQYEALYQRVTGFSDEG